MSTLNGNQPSKRSPKQNVPWHKKLLLGAATTAPIAVLVVACFGNNLIGKAYSLIANRGNETTNESLETIGAPRPADTSQQIPLREAVESIGGLYHPTGTGAIIDVSRNTIGRALTKEEVRLLAKTIEAKPANFIVRIEMHGMLPSGRTNRNDGPIQLGKQNELVAPLLALKQVSDLEISYTTANADTIRLVNKSPGIKKLSLGDCERIDDNAIAILDNERLDFLNLYHTNTSEKSFPTLAKLGSLKSLSMGPLMDGGLVLRNTDLKAFTQSANLETLSLEGVRVDEDESLSNMGNIPKLKDLSMTGGLFSLLNIESIGTEHLELNSFRLVESNPNGERDTLSDEDVEHLEKTLSAHCHSVKIERL